LQKLEENEVKYITTIADMKSEAVKNQEELTSLSIQLAHREDEVMDLKEKLEKLEPVSLTESQLFLKFTYSF